MKPLLERLDWLIELTTATAEQKFPTELQLELPHGDNSAIDRMRSKESLRKSVRLIGLEKSLENEPPTANRQDIHYVRA